MTTFLNEILKSGNKSKSEKIFFQPKLTINQPFDEYEQEANAVADQVVESGRTSLNHNPFFKPAISSVHLKEDTENLTTSSMTDNYLYSLSGGTSLPAYERSFFESKIGRDFSNVKLHTDSAANQSAKSINAKAYTHGNDIVFAANQYNPDTNTGKRLLAHELTHVVQQQNLHQSIQRERELNADESKECYKKIDETIKALEVSVGDENKKFPDYIREAVKVLGEKRDAGKIKCYAFEGIKHGRVDFTKDEIQYDGINTGWINETAILHEAVHASHGKKYPSAAKRYGKAVDDKKEIDPSKAGDLDLLKFKAWTEYWAYRSSQEYNNEQQKSDEEIHNSVMKIHEVAMAVNNVRKYDSTFDVRKWLPK